MPKVQHRFLTIISTIFVLAIAVLTLLVSEINNSGSFDSDILGLNDKFVREAVVADIIDGDTIKVEIDKQIQTVRLIGIDTPETKHPSKPVECFGKEASSYLESILKNRLIDIELDNTQDEMDRYGRLLGYIWLDGKNINSQMLAEGYAFEYTYNTPYKYQIEFKIKEKEAQFNNRGLWNKSTCNY